MTMRRLVPVVLLLTGGAIGRLHAACTTIPERPLFIRGTRGSIDRVFLSPDKEVTLRAPERSEASQAAPLAARDVLITMVFKSPADAKPVTFYVAGNDDCERLEEPACFIERLFCRRASHCVSGSAVGLTTGTDNGVDQLRFRFPQTHAAGPVSLAVTSLDQPPPLELQTEACGALKESARRSDLAVCIDALTLPDIDPPGVDPPPPCLVVLPPSNDYQAVCTPDGGDTTPNCTGTAADIQYTVDCDGNVLVPMIWGNILTHPQGGGPARRELRASTAVEAILNPHKRIYIPSGEFLETRNDLGGGFSPTPVFTPQELPDRPNEQTLFGTADKDSSVLRFLRRKPWGNTCNGGSNQSQGCERAEDCPGAQCVASAQAYFVCVGGARDTRACTRPQQCPGGTCQNVSVNGSVCYTPWGVPTGKPCKLDSDCGGKNECGAGLFEYRNRLVNGVGTLHRSASSSAPGVCDSGSNVGQPCTSAGQCNHSLLGGAACVTYRAEALTYAPPPP